MIHKTAEVQTEHIGKDTRVWQHTIVLKGARIGDHCNLCCHCFVENDVVIGDRVTLKSGVYVWDGVTLDDDVFVGPNVTFTNDLNPRSKRHRPALRTRLEQGASIGAGAILMPGIRIGKHAMVAAGSLVTKSVPDHALVYGSPARVRGFVCTCGDKVSADLRCRTCSTQFRKDGEGLSKV